MENKLDDIVNKSLNVDKTVLTNELIKKCILEIKNAINLNKELLLTTSQVDIKHDNGFELDFKIFDNIFNIIDNESAIYRSTTLSQKDNDKKIIYGKEIFDIGNVVIINDGNPYVLLELILRNLLVGNTSILCNDGYMYAVNQLLVEIIQSVLESLEISKYFVQLFVDDHYEDILEKYSSIDLVVCVGNHNLQQFIVSKCKNKIILSGYEYFDIYIESNQNISFVNKLMSLNNNINLFINSELDYSYSNAIYVDDIYEAVAQINFNGSSYASSIFTDNSENGSYFINNIKSKIVTVNTSPTIEQLIDIEQSDLFIEKTVIYPLSFNFDSDRVDVNIENM